MVCAKVFKSGNSQAVRIPKKFHIKGDRVEIIKINDELILREKPHNLKKALKLVPDIPEDFFASGREDNDPQDRDF